jgi:hypothetical protein
MKKLKLIVLFCFLICSKGIYAQRWGLDPYLFFLKDQRELNIEFSYDSMTVTTSLGSLGNDLETLLEPEFVAQKSDIFNKRDAGTGDKWTKDWSDARSLYFEPKFEEEFKKRLKDCGINATTKNIQAKYTIIIKATNITFGRIISLASGGYIGGNHMHNNRGRKVGTYMDYFVTIVETANRSNLMARASAKLVYGKHIPVFSVTRYKAKLVGPCFERAGKMFGKSAIKAMRK